MGDAYDREQYALPYFVRLVGGSFLKADSIIRILCRQNNALLNSLAQKTSALKSVTIDIYDNARNQETIDNTVRFYLFILCLDLLVLPFSPSLPFGTAGEYLMLILLFCCLMDRVKFSRLYQRISEGVRAV